MSEPVILNHYTNESALLSILSGGGVRSKETEIWASDALFLNDSSELLHGRKPLARALAAFLQARKDDPAYHLDGTSTYNLPAAVEYFSEYVREFSRDQILPHRVFVACFCEKSDLLSQWRGYGRGGYSIGFDRAELEAKAEPKAFEFLGGSGFYSQPIRAKLQKVLYGKAALDVGLEELLGPAGGALRGWQSYGQLQMLQTLARMKDRSFKSEKEWRLIYVRRGGRLGPINSPYAQSDLRPAADIRPGFNSTVPFLRMEFPKSTIKRIVVGPGGDMRLRELAVRRLCEDLELEVTIKRSKIPYRG